MIRKVYNLKQYRTWIYILLLISSSYTLLHLMVTTEEDLSYVDYTRSIVIENYTHCLKYDGKDVIIRGISAMMDYVGLEVILVEPSVLHCLLDPDEQELLRKRGYNATSWRGNKHITHFALIVNDSSELLQHDILSHASSMGFQVRALHTPRDSWLKFPSPTHYYFTHAQYEAHVIIMYKRDTYLWYSRVHEVPDELRNVTEGCLFGQWDSAFERFYPISFADEYGVKFFIPSSPSYFLLELDSRRFLECDHRRGRFVNDEERSRNGAYKKLKKGFTSALKEFKRQLRRPLIQVSIFAGTLLGWYRECDIMSHTSDIDFAAWASDVEDEYFWIDKFKGNPAMKLHQLMGLPEMAFELNFLVDDSSVDLFFLYENGTSLWVSGHRPSKGYYFSYNYPTFQLCSAALLGYKIQVPCEPEELIVAEYGLDWAKPMKEWYYEDSPKNMGPHIYWTEEERPRAYKVY